MARPMTYEELEEIRIAAAKLARDRARAELDAEQTVGSREYELLNQIGQIKLTMSKELLARGATAVISTQTGAAWLLMQELDIDFTDATRLLDELGRLGIIGPHAGGGRHDVLYRLGELDQAIELIEKEN